MNISEAVASRRSIRAFTDRPVDEAVLRRVIEKAQRAPSGGNTQPWNAVVVTGAELARVTAAVKALVAEAPMGKGAEYPIYPPELDGRYNDQRFAAGAAMFDSVGIARKDKIGRLQQMQANWDSFGAPVQLFSFCPKYMNAPQWSDMGMWLQTVMLLLREEGLDSCAQEIWAMYGEPMKELLGIPDDHIFFCGMAIGWRDSDAPINNFTVPRVPYTEAVTFRGF